MQLDVALATLLASVQADTTVEQSVLAYVQGVPALITAAVNDALANGATPAQLQQITDAAATLTANGAAITAAIKANTPAGPVTTTPPVIVP
jgi:alkylhydroperoxidase/carboxymuconolactone decarboxylase family protein YurZ